MKVIRASCLDKDFILFSHGDRTMVGDKGTTLSGGQKARVNLARCLYRDADIYLIDDPFAAVDPSVAKKISLSINSYLNDRTRLIVTHQSEYLPDSDHFFAVQDKKLIPVSAAYTSPDVKKPTASQSDNVIPYITESKNGLENTKKKLNDAKSGGPNENVVSGKMGASIYFTYLSLALPLVATFGSILFEMVSLGLVFFSDIILKFWIADVEKFAAECKATNQTDCNPEILSLPNGRKFSTLFIGINLAIPFICAFARVSFFRRGFKLIHPIRSYDLIANQIQINWINLKTQ